MSKSTQKSETRRSRPSKKRAVTRTQAAKEAARRWDNKVYGIVDVSLQVLKREIKDVCTLVKQADVELARMVREEGDVQAAYDRRHNYLQKKGQLIKQLKALN